MSLALGLALAACGEESPSTGQGPSGPRTGPGLSDDALVPLSGARPAHVVGASTFSRFHLLTTGEGFPVSAAEADATGIAPTQVQAVTAAEASATAALGKRKLRTAARGFVQAAVAARTAGWARREEGCLLRALRCFEWVQEPVEMLGVLRRVYALRVARKDSLAAARTRADLGCIYGVLANYDRAFDHLVPAAAQFKRFGMQRLQAHALASMGLAYHRRADYGSALDTLERVRALLASTRGARRKAYATNLLGNVYEHLGDPQRARALYREALAGYGKGQGVDKADVLGNLGSLDFYLGKDEDALANYEEAYALFEKALDARGMAGALFGMGRVRKMQGGYRTALDIYRRALDLQDDDPAGAARTRCAMAETYLAMGQPDDAMALIHTALDDVQSGSRRAEHVELLVVHALAHLRKKQPDQAVERIRRALDLLTEVTAGLADEHVVGVREHRGWVFDAGLAVALRTGRVDLATEFLEHARAGALLEALGARGAQHGLPPDLREQETLAAHRVARANRGYQEARAARNRKQLRSADLELQEARAAYRAVMQRLQRASKRAASVFHPVPDSLVDIRNGLADGDVFVLYALLPFQAHAVVVTKAEGGRIVWLGNTPDIRAACEALRADAADGNAGTPAAVEARLDRLHAMVLEPLGLPAATKRLLISPDGPLCYVPFPLLLRDTLLEVACLPSGTTLRLLARERERTGSHVLALGDPEYRFAHKGRSLQVYAEGVPLKPLPATRREVMAITQADDMRLLGSYATVRGLAEVVATRPRWSAIHLACHGLIDPRTPTLSALALTADAKDDGFLTALEVFGMALPADLVVLSGCDTGRGAFMKGEGLVGLMRAFMCAGSPRIVVSLWKVDDEATQALMAAFHRRWRAGALSAAAALREAQAEVRAVPKWRHPRYWGAWVLWGLVD